MEQPKNKNYKTYLFVIILVTAFSITMMEIVEQQTVLALISIVIAVSTIIFGLSNVLNVRGK